MVYQPADMRYEAIEIAEQRIDAARVKRMIMRQAYKEKTQAKLDKQKDAEVAKYERRMEMLDRALDKLNEDIQRASKRLEDVRETHALLVNIETHEL